MNIKTIVIAGVQEDIKITRTDAGATVSVERFTRAAGKHDHVIAEVGREEDRDARYAKAVEVAKAVYGTDRRGRAAATNSMVHDVLNEIERVAGC
ncbi:MAG: hypothetical protein KF769_16140 [Parvibaculum sp.]|nr:hypothetical protein [Parvibaculum sp.]MCW5775979.1 hypothetical protein [Phycisphaeraceae bacterium]